MAHAPDGDGDGDASASGPLAWALVGLVAGAYGVALAVEVGLVAPAGLRAFADLVSIALVGGAAGLALVGASVGARWVVRRVIGGAGPRTG